jgi:hypothetical protein
MVETIETQEGAPTTPDPNKVPWFSDLKAGTGAAEGMDPALRGALADTTVDRATEQVARADQVPWRKDLLEGQGAAEGMDPALNTALIEGTRSQAIEQAGQDIVAEDALRAAQEADARRAHNPHDPNSGDPEA